MMSEKREGIKEGREKQEVSRKRVREKKKTDR